MKRVALVGIGLAVVAAVAVGVVILRERGSGRQGDAVATAGRYRCPMHPSYTSDKPGRCAICGMDRVLVDRSSAEAAATDAPAGGRIVYYRSPMDPTVRSDTPAKDEMGMDFVPVYADELAAGPAPVLGRGAVTLTAERRQLLGVRSEEVREARLEHVIRTVARLAVDERRVSHVHTKYEGYVERLYVDFTGQKVRRGERLLSLYSPELVATQQEYLLAHRAQQELAQSGIASVSRGALDLKEAARQRLLFWDIRPVDIERLEDSGEVRRTLDLYSDIAGYVVQKTAVQGLRVTPGDTLFDIADLSRVWALADVYESDLRGVTVGTRGEVRVPYFPDRAWTGPVTFISPTVEEKTRTIKVRIELDNPKGELKPDMYADVFLRVDHGRGLVVAEDAVIDAGDRKLVFLDLGDGRFEPREVHLGPSVAGGKQVLSGLTAGDRVVTGANFLLDSESSLKAALKGMAPSPAGQEQPPHLH